MTWSSYTNEKSRALGAMSACRPKIFSCLLAIFILFIGDARADEDCFRSDSLGAFLSPPDRRLGAYRLELEPPDFRNRASVQEHWKHSILLGHLLKETLSTQTRNVCHADIDATSYPHLFVHLKRSSSPNDLEADRSRCTNELLGALQRATVDEARLRDIASRFIKTTVHSLAPFNVVIEAEADLWSSLSYVYDDNTVMSAILSVKPSELNSVELGRFLSWLDRQKQKRREALIPLRACSVGLDLPAGSLRKELQSSTVAPAVIKIIKNRISTRRALQRLIIVGASKEFAAENTFKVCKDISITVPPTGRASLDSAVAVPIITVPIKCIQVLPIRMDWWLGFYCDPNDCRSEVEEETVIEAIMKSLDPLAALGFQSNDARLSGPYLIKAEIQPEQ